MVVYKITNLINGLSYIGQTIRNPEKRWKEHLNDANKKKSPFHHALKSYGVENFKFEILFHASNLEELNKKEEELASTNIYPTGYNLKNGGDNKKYSDFSKKKISKSHLGKKTSENTKLKISESVKKQNLENPEILAKRLAGLSKIHNDPQRSSVVSKQFAELWKDPNFRDRLSKTKKGVAKSKDHAENISLGRLKSFSNPFNVFKIDKINNTKSYVGTWENPTTCANDLNISQSKVSMVLNKQRKSHKGFTFEKIESKEN